MKKNALACLPKREAGCYNIFPLDPVQHGLEDLLKASRPDLKPAVLDVLGLGPRDVLDLPWFDLNNSSYDSSWLGSIKSPERDHFSFIVEHDDAGFRHPGRNILKAERPANRHNPDPATVGFYVVCTHVDSTRFPTELRDRSAGAAAASRGCVNSFTVLAGPMSQLDRDRLYLKLLAAAKKAEKEERQQHEVSTPDASVRPIWNSATQSCSTPARIGDFVMVRKTGPREANPPGWVFRIDREVRSKGRNHRGKYTFSLLLTPVFTAGTPVKAGPRTRRTARHAAVVPADLVSLGVMVQDLNNVIRAAYARSAGHDDVQGSSSTV